MSMTTRKPEVIDGLLFNLDAVVAQWVNARINPGLVEVPSYAIGILRPGIASGEASANIADDLIAGAYFYNLRRGIKGFDPETNETYEWSTIDCAVACDDITAATPDLIGRLLHYPFGQLGVDVIIGWINTGNNHAITEARKLGFRNMGQIPSLKNGGGITMMGMRKDWCKFWPVRDRTPAEAAA
jgi:hypothetical protein